VITVHPAPSHTTAKPAGSVTGTPDGTEAAAGDLFAVLMAALMPQAAVTDGAAPTLTPTTAAGGTVTAVAGEPGATGDAAKGPTALLTTDMPTAAIPGLETAAAAIAAPGPHATGTDGLGDADAAKAGATAGEVVDLTTGSDAAPKTEATNTALLNPTLAPQQVAERTSGDGTETDGETAETTTGSVDAIAGSAKKDAVPVATTLEDTIETPTTHHVIEAPHQPVVHAVENPHADTTPIAAPMPHQQLAAVIAPLRRGADGEYRLAIRLRPEHLGTVDVDVQLHHGTVEVHVRTEHADAHHLLSEHLDDLRRELENAGLRTGNLDVSERDDNRQAQAGNGQGQRSPVDPRPGADGAATPTTTNRDAARPVQDGSVDIDI
jgi:flagellar hook-length control protein FliK